MAKNYTPPGLSRKNKHGIAWGSNRKIRKAERNEQLQPEELNFKKAYFCFLKAADYSYSYISDHLNITKALCREWYSDPKIQAEISRIQDDMISGAIMLIHQYTVEAVEMLMEIARKTGDDSVASKILWDILDRAGVSKVVKSEQTRTNVESVDITDTTGLFDRISAAPIETQTQIAEMMGEMERLLDEAKGSG